jgi:hypothetical protein
MGKSLRSKRSRRIRCGNAIPTSHSQADLSHQIESDVYGEAVFGEAIFVDLPKSSLQDLRRAQAGLVEITLSTDSELLIPFRLRDRQPTQDARPPFNAEYLLYLFLHRDEREGVIGDLAESYGVVVERFNKRRADIWFYKQVAGSLFPIFRRYLLKIGTVVWLGRMLRRLIS